MIGSRLGPYELVEKIGVGGMAMVYRAYQPRMDRYVAIKVIRHSNVKNSLAIDRFQREAKLVARLEHPHLLPIYDFDGGHDPPYIVMRYLEGSTLKYVLKQGLLPHPEVLYLLRQVSNALDYAHNQGVVHRDIKPSNVMIDKQGNAFVTDFGIAREKQSTSTDKDENGLTDSEMIVGTPNFMSPEQAMGQAIDHRSDIYSVGVMLYYILTGVLPFNDDTPMKIIIKHIQEPPPSIRETNGKLTKKLDQVIQKALEKDPGKRHQSLSDLYENTKEALGVEISSEPETLQSIAEISIDSQILKREAIQSKIDDTITQFKAERTDTGTGSKPIPSEHNKIITVLTGNVEEYSEIIEDADGPGKAIKSINKLWDRVEHIIEEFNGKLFIRNQGDIMAIWGADTIREDDSIQALRASLKIKALIMKSIKNKLGDDYEEHPFGIGINTGSALLVPKDKSGEFSISGSILNIANKLASRSEGKILASHATYRTVRGVFTVSEDTPIPERRGSGKLAVYDVKSEKARAFRRSTRGVEGIETVMIGREAEFNHMKNAFYESMEERETQVITLHSEAGLGKSRLLSEFANWSDLQPQRYYIFRGRATAIMTQRPYSLLRDLLSFRFEILDNDNPEIVIEKMETGVKKLIGDAHEETAHFMGYLVGFDFSSSPLIAGLLDDPHQLTQRARQLSINFFVKLTDILPVVFRLEDLHLSDDESLDLFNELISNHQDLPILMVATARPELRLRRKNWGSGQPFHTQLELQPLDRRNSRKLVREILQKMKEVPKVLRDLIVDRTEGNPYFTEEFIKMLIEDRIINKDRAIWTIELDRLENLSVPPTLVGLLQARVDSLLYPERVLLERASVIGKIFYDTALIYLEKADEVFVDNVHFVLKKLMDLEFITLREISSFSGNSEYIFEQSMLRETIYDNLVPRRREDYHIAAAEWIISAAGDRVDEYTAIIAGNYELGGENEKAFHFLSRAGDRAFTASAFEIAKHDYEKAISLISEENQTEKLDILLKLGDIYLQLGELSTAHDLLTQALNLASNLQDLDGQANALYLFSQASTIKGDYEEAVDILEYSLTLARGDAANETLAKVLYGLGDTLYRAGNIDKSKEACKESLEISREINNYKIELLALNRLGTIYTISDPEKSQKLLEDCLKLAREIGNRQMEIASLGNLGEVAANSRNDYQKALNYVEEALPVALELGDLRTLLIFELNSANYNISLGNVDEGREILTSGLNSINKLGSNAWALAGASVLARLYLFDGDQDKCMALLGLIVQNPATSSDVIEGVNLIIGEIKDQGISDNDIDLGMKAGEHLDLTDEIDDFLHSN